MRRASDRRKAGAGATFAALAAFVAGCALVPAGRYAVPDVTARLERLGIPLEARYPSDAMVFARNPWSLRAWQGRLYIGCGNAANEGPAQNAGPVPVCCYDPALGTFLTEATLDDEQIDLILTAPDGSLVIPGCDPRSGWDLGTLHRRTPGGKWTTLRTIPDGVHTLALAWHEGRLWAGIGRPHGSAVVVSADDGLTWSVAATGRFHRVYGFLAAGGTLCAIERVPGSGRIPLVRPSDPDGPAWAWECADDTAVPRRDLTARVLFPDVQLHPHATARISRSAATAAGAVYIGATVHNDLHARPFGLYVARSLRRDAVDIRAANLQGAGDPWDVISRDGSAWVLAQKPVAHGFAVTVLESRDLELWTPRFTFRAPALVRSFERLDGDFYFGLGCDVERPASWSPAELAPETGLLLRLRRPTATAPP